MVLVTIVLSLLGRDLVLDAQRKNAVSRLPPSSTSSLLVNRAYVRIPREVCDNLHQFARHNYSNTLVNGRVHVEGVCTLL